MQATATLIAVALLASAAALAVGAADRLLGQASSSWPPGETELSAQPESDAALARSDLSVTAAAGTPRPRRPVLVAILLAAVAILAPTLAISALLRSPMTGPLVVANLMLCAAVVILCPHQPTPVRTADRVRLQVYVLMTIVAVGAWAALRAQTTCQSARRRDSEFEDGER